MNNDVFKQERAMSNSSQKHMQIAYSYASLTRENCGGKRSLKRESAQLACL